MIADLSALEQQDFVLARAEYAHSSTVPGTLSFEEGQMLILHSYDPSDEWWYAVCATFR